MLTQIKKPHSISILGMRVDMIQIPETIELMEDWIVHKSHGHDIVVSNANDAVICKKNFMVQEAINSSSLSVPDGISLIILARWHKFPLKKRVYGPDLMDEFLKKAQKTEYTNFFYGATDLVLEKLVSNLKERFPSLKIAGSYAPPFRELTQAEEESNIEIINKACPDVLWVGLGCPKQQLWMHRNKNKLKVPVMVGVGAAFDFFAKTKPQAPHWVRDNGFEWLFRLITEPRRLWKRYLINGSLFFFYCLGELVCLCLSKNRKKRHN